MQLPLGDIKVLFTSDTVFIVFLSLFIKTFIILWLGTSGIGVGVIPKYKFLSDESVIFIWFLINVIYNGLVIFSANRNIILFKESIICKLVSVNCNLYGCTPTGLSLFIITPGVFLIFHILLPLLSFNTTSEFILSIINILPDTSFIPLSGKNPLLTLEYNTDTASEL